MPSPPVRVLIVEDSKLTTQQLCELLTSSYPGLHCSTSETEKEALQKVTSEVFDIVILDLALKQGTGFSVLKRVASLAPRPLAIVLTNYALPNYRDFAMLTGADYFLDKSTSLEELPRILAGHLKD